MQDQSFKDKWLMAINDNLPDMNWPKFDSNQDISQLKNLEKKSLSINILYNY